MNSPCSEFKKYYFSLTNKAYKRKINLLMHSITYAAVLQPVSGSQQSCARIFVDKITDSNYNSFVHRV